MVLIYNQNVCVCFFKGEGVGVFVVFVGVLLGWVVVISVEIWLWVELCVVVVFFIVVLDLMVVQVQVWIFVVMNVVLGVGDVCQVVIQVENCGDLVEVVCIMVQIVVCDDIGVDWMDFVWLMFYISDFDSSDVLVVIVLMVVNGYLCVDQDVVVVWVLLWLVMVQEWLGCGFDVLKVLWLVVVLVLGDSVIVMVLQEFEVCNGLCVIDSQVGFEGWMLCFCVVMLCELDSGIDYVLFLCLFVGDLMVEVDGNCLCIGGLIYG